MRLSGRRPAPQRRVPDAAGDRELTGRAFFEANGGIQGEPEVVLQAETGALHIRSDSFLDPEIGAPFEPSVGSYYAESRVSGPYYSFKRGDVTVTAAAGGVMEGEFDLVFEATLAFVLKSRVRARGRFRVVRL